MHYRLAETTMAYYTRKLVFKEPGLYSLDISVLNASIGDAANCVAVLLSARPDALVNALASSFSRIDSFEKLLLELYESR